MSDDGSRGRVGSTQSDTFLGRRAIRHTVLQALHDLGTGRSTEGMLVEGLHRAGRTRLLQWSGQQATARRWLVMPVAATNATPTTLWSATTTLADSLRRLRPGALGVRALQEAVDTASAGGDEARDVAAACRTIARLVADAAEECRTLVLVTVDDAERWGPAAGNAIFQLLAPARRSRPLLVAAAHLPGLQVPGEPAQHRLGPLDLEDLRSESRLGLDLRTLEHLREASGGWPAVIEALLREPQENWLLEAHDHHAQITATLTSAQRRYLETVVALGEGPIPIGLVAKALGDSTRFSAESSTLTGIRAALNELGLLHEPTPGQVDIAMAGYRDHLLSSRQHP